MRYFVTLKPKSAWHLQTGGLEHERVDVLPRADTLSAALMSVSNTLYGNGSIDINTFPRVSSIFPAIQQKNEIKRLFFKPVVTSIQIPDQELVALKTIKRCTWVTERVLLDVRLQKQLIFSDLNPTTSKFGILSYNSENLSLNAPLMQLNTRDRVTLDRVTSASVPFQFSAMYPSDSMLWHFEVEMQPTDLNYFKSLIQLLGDSGIGAERTVGLGQFELIDIKEVEDAEILNANGFINMGMFNPNPELDTEIMWGESFYDIIHRQGWTSYPVLRRKSINMVAEGSVIKTNSSPIGRLVKVLDPDDKEMTPSQKQALSHLDHPVYRDGRGYFITCLVKES